MTAVNRDHPLPTPSVIDRDKCTIPSSGTTMVLHAKDKADIQPTYEALKKMEDHFKVFLKTNIPASYHYAHQMMLTIG